MPRISAGATALLATCCACTDQARTTPPPAPRVEVRSVASTTAPPDAAASAAATPPWDGGLPSFVSWTDPRAAQALLAGANLPSDTHDPRSCQFEVPEQSCVPGPEGIAWSCKSDCANTCDRCGADCRSKIAACRSECHSGATACEDTCGKQAGGCVQGCLDARDRCATGECNKLVADYVEEVRTNYGCKDKRPALEVCKRAVACFAACDQGNPSDEKREACRDRCKKTRAVGCNDHFLQVVDTGFCVQFESGI
jgi:hypothetical protein